MKRVVLGAVCSTMAALLLWSTGAAGMSITGLGYLSGGTDWSLGTDISANGTTVAGDGISSDGTEAIRWMQGDGMSGLGALAGGEEYYSRSSAISGDGSTVAGWSYSANGDEAFRWTESGGMEGLGVLAGGSWFSSYAYGVSGDGLAIVGRSSSSFRNGFEAFRWTQSDGMVGLGGLDGGRFGSQADAISADGSAVVGYSHSANGWEAFRWTEAGGMEGLGSLDAADFDSRARAISADGSAVVGYSHSANGVEAFRWTQSDGMAGLGDLEGGTFSSTAHDVSADGSVIVGTSDSDSPDVWDAFVWDESNGMQSLQSILEDGGVDMTGWSQLFEATGISADGTMITGYGRHHGTMEAFVAVIPEPAGIAMISLCSGFIYFGRRFFID